MSAAIATMTWARDKAEAAALLHSLGILSETSMPVFVADGGSPAAFRKAIGALPNVQITTQGSTLVEQVRAAVKRAATSGADLIVYTEPDKAAFFRKRLAGFIRAAEKQPEAQIVVASRSNKAMATFPEGQQRTEKFFNDLARDYFGTSRDILYGPLILRAGALSFLDDAAPDLGWGWRPYVMARAVAAQLPVAVHKGRFVCPQAQRREDTPADRLYRIKQLGDNLRGLLSGLHDAVR